MGAFGNNYQRQAGQPPVAAEDNKPGSDVAHWTMCDRCRTARAKVEVITDAGSVFLCEHHHKKHRGSIIAAGHQIRGRPGESSLL